jgi:diguanylate cyclase (GGDEF)-like protein
VAERLRKSLAETPFKLNGFEILITASMGVVAISDEYPTLQAMILAADQLMYQAKQNGRNNVMVPA